LLLPFLLVAALVFGVVSVLSARPELRKAERAVADAWTPLQGQLTTRYRLLDETGTTLAQLGGPVRELAGSVDVALTRWNSVTSGGTVATQVRAANEVEALGRRLVAAARASERVKANAEASEALNRYAGDRSFGAAGDFNAAVREYEEERQGPVRSLVAAFLGTDDIPAFQPAA
jgi:hypothetical protein